MKRVSVFLFALILFNAEMFVSCNHGVPVAAVSSNKKVSEKNCDPKYQAYKPRASENTIFWDDFEGKEISSKNPWETTGASLITLGNLKSQMQKDNPGNKTWIASYFNPADSQVLVLDAGKKTTSKLTYSNLSLNSDCSLTFAYFLVAESESSFKVVLNENEEVWFVNGTSELTVSEFQIKYQSVKIPAGTKSISLIANNSSETIYSKWPNAVFIDDISLVYDKVTSVIVTPRASQKTYVDCADKEKIRVTAYALRADGSYVENAAITFACPNGNIDSRGYFTPVLAGTTRITAECNGITGVSGQISVDDDSSCAGPVTVGGVTYTGIKTDNGEKLSEQNPVKINFNPESDADFDSDAKIDFEYPATNSITADGFVRIKGRLTASTKDHSDYDRVVITVSSGFDIVTYICEADFDLRVWLPFDKNAVSVMTAKIESNTYKDENGKNWEGDFKFFDCDFVYQINAKNTHQSDVNRLYIYPSGFCQSDNYLVQNFTNEALYDLEPNASAEEKFRAIHDYICLNMYYDHDSIECENARKKQDAVSVIENRTAVCEGYADLTAAMARCAGIPCGVVISLNLNHAWNHVWINGTELFCDTTWDDLDKKPLSYFIYYNYYLLKEFDGVNLDHNPESRDMEDDRYIDSRQADFY